jgi:cbb3-type cytochrome oxidase subunit 1
MDPFVRGFIRAALLWLCLGVTLGVVMSFWPYALMVRPAHMHANLLGFVSMMIFGVAYHVLPRFSGSPLHSPRLAVLHLWIANAGLLLMVAGWIARVWLPSAIRAVQLGGLLSAAGAFLFAWNLWRTLGASRPAGAPLPPMGRRP